MTGPRRDAPVVPDLAPLKDFLERTPPPASSFATPDLGDLKGYLDGIEVAPDAVRNSLAPLSEGVKAGIAEFAAPATSPRPTRRPEAMEYGSTQPHVVVESTFESSPRVEVGVTVDMPVTIRRELMGSNAETAREAGRQAGAATERAVRRSLDDAALAE